MLRQHDHVALPEDVKETFFFEKARTEVEVEEYFRRFFSTSESNKMFGEVSPTYFHIRMVPKIIKSAFPDIKVVVTLRNPVERSISLFKHHLTKGRVDNRFSHAILEKPEIITSGKFKSHLINWIDEFGSDNVKVMLYDDLIDREQYFSSLAEFLGLKNDDKVEILEKYGQITYPSSRFLAKVAAIGARKLRKYNLHGIVEAGKKFGLKKVYAGGKDRSLITEQDIECLYSEYTEDIDFVEELLSRKLSNWRKESR